MFDVSAARSGDVLFGGFRYQELRPDGTRGQVIYSQAVTGLRVLGNTATVDAVGYWNNMLCDLTIEALDDLSDDWSHITARPRGPLTIIYDQAGGLIKGDLQVFSAPRAPDIRTSGSGMIGASSTTVGRFAFRAEKTSGAVRGTISGAVASSAGGELPGMLYVQSLDRS